MVVMAALIRVVRPVQLTKPGKQGGERWERDRCTVCSDVRVNFQATGGGRNNKILTPLVT